jgi:S-adenosylmethionine decarboxylase proenzyme
MFSNQQYNSSGKHMICDIKNIKNHSLIHDLEHIKHILDTICINNNFTILNKIEHIFEPQGLSILYLLSESHISIHTFPERNYIAFDLYTCRNYSDNSCYLHIYNYLIECFGADKENPMIIDRCF